MTEKKTRLSSRALPRVEVGILGGTGLYEIEGIQDLEEYRLRTPLGEPSEAYLVGRLRGRRVAFLSRHGRGHRLLPMEINYRANVYGFKMLGVERVISVSSVGSLRGTSGRAISFSPTSSSIRPTVAARSSARGSPPTSPSPNRSVRSCPNSYTERPSSWASARGSAERTSAWRVRPSRQGPSRASIASGAGTSSA